MSTTDRILQWAHISSGIMFSETRLKWQLREKEREKEIEREREKRQARKWVFQLRKSPIHRQPVNCQMIKITEKRIFLSSANFSEGENKEESKLSAIVGSFYHTEHELLLQASIVLQVITETKDDLLEFHQFERQRFPPSSSSFSSSTFVHFLFLSLKMWLVWFVEPIKSCQSSDSNVPAFRNGSLEESLGRNGGNIAR